MTKIKQVRAFNKQKVEENKLNKYMREAWEKRTEQIKDHNKRIQEFQFARFMGYIK